MPEPAIVPGADNPAVRAALDDLTAATARLAGALADIGAAAPIHLLRVPTLRFMVDGEPVSKGRPRVGANRNVYTPDQTEAAEANVAAAFARAYPRWRAVADFTFGIQATFWCKSFRRRDSDNMLKLVMDGLNHWVWADDAQVIENVVAVHRGADTPRTDIEIWTLPTPPGPTRPRNHDARTARTRRRPR